MAAANHGEGTGMDDESRYDSLLYSRQVQKVKYATAHHIRNYLRNLKFIVLDEMHMYRGTFGSHVALVLRRLLKVCRELVMHTISRLSRALQRLRTLLD